MARCSHSIYKFWTIYKRQIFIHIYVNISITWIEIQTKDEKNFVFQIVQVYFQKLGLEYYYYLIGHTQMFILRPWVRSEISIREVLILCQVKLMSFSSELKTTSFNFNLHMLLLQPLIYFKCSKWRLICLCKIIYCWFFNCLKV